MYVVLVCLTPSGSHIQINQAATSSAIGVVLAAPLLLAYCFARSHRRLLLRIHRQYSLQLSFGPSVATAYCHLLRCCATGAWQPCRQSRLFEQSGTIEVRGNQK